MSRRSPYPWWVGPVTFFAPLFVRVLGLTWRIEERGEDPSTGPVGARACCIFAFWHFCLPPLVYTHRGRGGAVLTSRHLDGELVARILTSLGYHLARGSSTRGGDVALRRMVGLADRGRFLAVTPDGPHGPPRVAKRGVVFLASATGLPVIPVATATRSAFVLRSWDRMRVPRPFARVHVRYGTPLRVPAELDDAGMESWRLRIENELTSITADLEREAGVIA
jgi:lysophospholipid acyltransferase (LPLAT)-like uncharacterized protein